eukprot:283325-Amphidinium_carterae.1
MQDSCLKISLGPQGHRLSTTQTITWDHSSSFKARRTVDDTAPTQLSCTAQPTRNESHTKQLGKLWYVSLSLGKHSERPQRHKEDIGKTHAGWGTGRMA